jgi:hypothetical protein
MLRSRQLDAVVSSLHPSHLSLSPRKHCADPLKIVRGLRKQVSLGRIEPGCLLLEKCGHAGEQWGSLQVADVA